MMGGKRWVKRKEREGRQKRYMGIGRKSRREGGTKDKSLKVEKQQQQQQLPERLHLSFNL